MTRKADRKRIANFIFTKNYNLFTLRVPNISGWNCAIVYYLQYLAADAALRSWLVSSLPSKADWSAFSRLEQRASYI